MGPDHWSADLGLVQDDLPKPRTGLDYWLIGLVRTSSPLIGPGPLGSLAELTNQSDESATHQGIKHET